MVKPGEPILKHLTANWFNDVTNSTSRILGGLNLAQTGSQTILVQNHSTTAKNKYDAVALGDPVLEYDGNAGHVHNDIVFETGNLSNSQPHNWVVLLEPLPGRVGASARALIHGLSWVRIPTVEGIILDKYLMIHSDNALRPAPFGKGHIHYEAIEDTTSLALTTIGNPPASATMFFTLIGDMATTWAGYETTPVLTSRGLANFHDETGSVYFVDYLYGWEGMPDDATIGYTGSAELFNGIWRFEQGPCTDGGE